MNGDDDLYQSNKTSKRLADRYPINLDLMEFLLHLRVFCAHLLTGALRSRLAHGSHSLGGNTLSIVCNTMSANSATGMMFSIIYGQGWLVDPL